ncbi:MAG: ABC transporter ATP-binding protein [bacterium]|uniref:ATP-binding transport protein n=2 Tax=Bacteria candidate phyla TaxID=1783234 RepID=A0A101I396_UNCT6|nr:MAG: ATP-binding transport protein [candidate division TA06 bacterium 32_111]KUK88157.1 MAG: ATP-binding transport protein [candidate division TA06 bacterium 34_109]MDI6700959.1 ABC transporter ATP-binding protein [bacterium]HAF07087.1 multidrug ABC transporter ATP-binding protein [candidate division WOR-3 bacterium]HCP17166.1 multidrug ABC transporter ATP-binding protein [candidate division WOR-3 bacterium]
MVVVKVENLQKNFGKVKALRGISFECFEGEIFGLIGPNGAGKSTCLRILSTILSKSEGEVKIFDYDVSEKMKIKRIISYLPEDAGAYKNLKGIDYLKFFVNFFTDVQDKDKTLEYGIELSSLGERLNDKIETYSKGMVRRLLIARSLMINPKLAILDEPTSGLDVINATQIRDIIKNKAKEGTTFIVSSHNMLEVDYLCDRISLINNGLIVESGDIRGLKEKYRAQNIEEIFVKVVGVKNDF